MDNTDLLIEIKKNKKFYEPNTLIEIRDETYFKFDSISVDFNFKETKVIFTHNGIKIQEYTTYPLSRMDTLHLTNVFGLIKIKLVTEQE